MATGSKVQKVSPLMISQKLPSVWSASLAILVACVVLPQPGAMAAAPVAVRHTEGLVHGFLVLRTLSGDTLADGDLIQIARGYRVTSRLVFHFKDGSVHDETADISDMDGGNAFLPEFVERFNDWVKKGGNHDQS